MGALGFKAVSMTQLAVSNDAHDHKEEAGYSGCERNLALQGTGEGCSDLLQSPTQILQVHLPSSLGGRHTRQ